MRRQSRRDGKLVDELLSLLKRARQFELHPTEEEERLNSGRERLAGEAIPFARTSGSSGQAY